MQIFNYNAYDWNRAIAPYGNMAKVDPQTAADLCDYYGLPWYTDGWPYASGIKVRCDSDDLWKEILAKSKF